jgi:hypothetical protein
VSRTRPGVSVRGPELMSQRQNLKVQGGSIAE